MTTDTKFVNDELVRKCQEFNDNVTPKDEIESKLQRWYSILRVHNIVLEISHYWTNDTNLFVDFIPSDESVYCRSILCTFPHLGNTPTDPNQAYNRAMKGI